LINILAIKKRIATGSGIEGKNEEKEFSVKKLYCFASKAVKRVMGT